MGKKILAVDDSQTMRQMVCYTLRGAGYEVIEAEDGVDALGKAEKELFHMVLIDHNMPRMDGLTLVSHLRVMPAYKSVPIVFLTTESSDAIKVQGRAAGATGWMVKPFDPERLLEVVKKVIG